MKSTPALRLLKVLGIIIGIIILLIVNWRLTYDPYAKALLGESIPYPGQKIGTAFFIYPLLEAIFLGLFALLVIGALNLGCWIGTYIKYGEGDSFFTWRYLRSREKEREQEEEKKKETDPDLVEALKIVEKIAPVRSYKNDIKRVE